jgi:hypothetical protein
VDISTIIESALDFQWLSSQAVYLDTNLPLCAPAVGLFVALVDTGLFTVVSDDEFSRCWSHVKDRIAPFFLTGSTTDRLLLMVTFSNLLYLGRLTLDFSVQRSRAFFNAVIPLLKGTVRSVLEPYAIRMKAICNQFISGKFDLDTLLHDFTEIVGAAEQALPFNVKLNSLIHEQFLLDFEVSVIDRLVGSDSQFTFEKAIVWSSFLTTLEADFSIPLPYLQELVRAMNMVPAICEEPELTLELCPSLPLATVAFLVAHFVPDNLHPESLTPDLILAKCGLQSVPTEPIVPPPAFMRFVPVSDIPWENWTECKFEPGAHQAFPFLNKYLSVV